MFGRRAGEGRCDAQIYERVSGSSKDAQEEESKRAEMRRNERERRKRKQESIESINNKIHAFLWVTFDVVLLYLTNFWTVCFNDSRVNRYVHIRVSARPSTSSLRSVQPFYSINPTITTRATTLAQIIFQHWNCLFRHFHLPYPVRCGLDALRKESNNGRTDLFAEIDTYGDRFRSHSFPRVRILRSLGRQRRTYIFARAYVPLFCSTFSLSR